MIYFRPHVRALERQIEQASTALDALHARVSSLIETFERQIDDFKQRLSESDSRNVVLQADVIRLTAEAALADALKLQLSDVQERLALADEERQSLLDRLLERNNYQPIRQSAAESETQERPVVQLISPFNSIPLEAQDAIKESWLREETEYVMMAQGLDEPRARAVAESNWEAQNRPIH